jgi:hypothetical protein
VKHLRALRDKAEIDLLVSDSTWYPVILGLPVIEQVRRFIHKQKDRMLICPASLLEKFVEFFWVIVNHCPIRPSAASRRSHYRVINCDDMMVFVQYARMMARKGCFTCHRYAAIQSVLAAINDGLV